MSTTEQTTWRWLRRNTRALARTLDLERIENSVSSGRPDINGCMVNCFDIESKIGVPLKDGTVSVKWRKLQKPWLRRRWSVGGLSWALIQVGQGAKADRYLIRGCDLHNDNELPTSELKGYVVQHFTVEELEDLSVIDPRATAVQLVNAAAGLKFG